MSHHIVEMSLDRYDELLKFWKYIDGLWLSDDDEYDNLQRFLLRNPGLSLIAVNNGQIVGTIKCGHDGRRGYLHHLAVKKDFRNQGLGRELVDTCVRNLRKEGITKIRVFVLDANAEALSFWRQLGFSERQYDYRTLSLDF